MKLLNLKFGIIVVSLPLVVFGLSSKDVSYPIKDGDKAPTSAACTSAQNEWIAAYKNDETGVQEYNTAFSNYQQAESQSGILKNTQYTKARTKLLNAGDKASMLEHRLRRETNKTKFEKLYNKLKKQWSIEATELQVLLSISKQHPELLAAGKGLDKAIVHRNLQTQAFARASQKIHS